MTVNDLVELVGRTLEVLGVTTIALTAFIALAGYLTAILQPTSHPDGYATVRRRVGQGVLLGLEILVAGDISAPSQSILRSDRSRCWVGSSGSARFCR